MWIKLAQSYFQIIGGYIILLDNMLQIETVIYSAYIISTLQILQR